MGKVTIVCALLLACMAVTAFGQLGACHNTPDPADHRAYFVNEGGVKTRMLCAPGTLYSPVTCACGVNLVSGIFHHPIFPGYHHPYGYYPW